MKSQIKKRGENYRKEPENDKGGSSIFGSAASNRALGGGHPQREEKKRGVTRKPRRRKKKQFRTEITGVLTHSEGAAEGRYIKKKEKRSRTQQKGESLGGKAGPRMTESGRQQITFLFS